MTQEEMKKKSDAKRQAILAQCELMNIKLVAKKVITREGFIEDIVVFQDTEKYDIDEPESNQPNKKQDEISKEDTKPDMDDNIAEEGTEPEHGVRSSDDKDLPGHEGGANEGDSKKS